MPRSATLTRETLETRVHLELELDGGGPIVVQTGVPFLDHMLSSFARHGGFGLTVRAEGDLAVDLHHTVEDVGIVLGQAWREALGDKRGVARFGHAYVPLDEALVRTVVDLSGRPFLSYQVNGLSERVGDFATDLAEEFLRALATNAAITLHVDMLRGRNAHHVLEAAFKSLGLALRDASRRVGEEIPSTKGTL